MTTIDEILSTEEEEAPKTSAELKAELKAAKKRERQNRKPSEKKSKARSVQNLIGYKQMAADGLCLVREGVYSITLAFTDINRQHVSTEDQIRIFEQECEFINYIEPGCTIQYLARNRRVTADETRDRYLPYDPADICGLNGFKEDFNAHLARQIGSGGLDRVLEHYYTFSVAAKNEESGRAQLDRIADEVIKRLSHIGSKATVLNGTERLRVLNDFFDPYQPLVFDFRSLPESNLTTKDAIAPSAITVMLRPADVMTVNGGYYRFLVLSPKTGYPPVLEDRLMAALGSLDADIYISFHLEPVPQRRALDLIEEKIVSLTAERASIRRRAIGERRDTDAYTPLELIEAIEETTQLRGALRNSNQKMFMGTYTVCVYGKTLEELEESTLAVRSAGAALSYRFTPLETSKVLIDAMNATLPLGVCDLKQCRTMLTTNAAMLTPFWQSDTQHNSSRSVYYGVNPVTKRLIMLDRTELPAGHAARLGTTGSGKSLLSKLEILQLLAKYPNLEVWISDPKNEYQIFVESMGGLYIPVEPGSQVNIDVFDIARDPKTGMLDIPKKSQFLQGLIEGLVNPLPEYAATIRSIIDVTVKKLYEEYERSNGDTNQPTMTEFINELEKHPEPQMASVATILRSYESGTMTQFTRQTNIRFDRRIYAFGMRDAGATFKEIAAHVINDFLYQRMLSNYEKGVITALYFDEVQTSFKNHMTKEYLLNLWATSRQFLGMATAITQIPETLTDDPDARNVLLNSHFVSIFAVRDKRRIIELYNLSYDEATHINKPEPGSGLHVIDGQIVPFTDDLKDSRLKRIVTTKSSEMVVTDNA